MKTYQLVGPHAGKDIVLGNFSFKGGAIEVQDKEVEAVGPIVERFYQAVPADKWEDAQRAYERENKIPASASRLPKPPAPTAPPGDDKDKK